MNPSRRWWKIDAQMTACLIFAALSLLTAPLAAQEESTTEFVPEEKQQKSEDPEGVDGMLSISANFNLVSNNNVVGQPNGFSTLFGLGLTGGVDYISGKHELRNTLRINESWARTPAIEQFVKNTDNLELESLYNYFVAKWTGAFARLNFETQIFQTNRVTQTGTNYAEVDVNGNTTGETFSNQTQFELSNPFKPFALSQSFGWFAEPIREPEISLSARIGLGARETFANNVRVVTNADSAPVEYRTLGNIYQAGVEGFLGAEGGFEDANITYNAGFSALIPFLNNDIQDRSGIDLTRIGVRAGLTFNMFEWMSADYVLRLTRDPQLIDGLQVQNNFLLTFKYSFIERGKGKAKKPEPSLDQQLQKAKKEADQAEERVEELKEKVEEEKEQEEEKKREEQQQKELERQQRQQERQQQQEDSEPPQNFDEN